MALGVRKTEERNRETGHTLGTAPGGRILECTYIGGLVPSLIIGHDPVFRLGNPRPMAHDELARGMALGGYIHLRNHDFVRINALTPVVGFYPI